MIKMLYCPSNFKTENAIFIANSHLNNSSAYKKNVILKFFFIKVDLYDSKVVA